MKLHAKDPGIIGLFFMLMTLTMVGCGPSQATFIPAESVSLPTANVSVAANLSQGEILNKSIQSMSNLKSYHFVTRDTSSMAQQAPGLEGDFEAPDKLRMTSSIKGQGLVGMMIIGEDRYIKQPNTNAYTKVAHSKDTVAGAIPHEALLAAAPTITNTRILGDDKIDGVDVIHIRSNYDATKKLGLPDSASSVIGTGQVDLWIDRNNYYVHQQAALGTTVTPPTVFIIYSKFNEPIVPPIEGP